MISLCFVSYLIGLSSSHKFCFWAAAPEGQCLVEYRGYFVRLYVHTYIHPYVRPYPPGPSSQARAPRPGPPDQGPQTKAPRPGSPGQGPQVRAPRPGPLSQGLRLAWGLQARASKPRIPGHNSRPRLPGQHLDSRAPRPEPQA